MTPQAQQPISDDQELAKVLAGVNQDTNVEALSEADNAAMAAPATPVTDDIPMPPLEDPAAAPEPAPEIIEPVSEPTYTDSSDLDAIKKGALSDLRPLVDKLDIAPEEKFDTYLLLLRSTDDKNLIPSAYEAARAIPDEARRAQALLDVIKEIDYLSAPKQ